MTVKKENKRAVFYCILFENDFILDEELIQAEEKLEESKRLAEQAMYNVISNDVKFY